MERLARAEFRTDSDIVVPLRMSIGVATYPTDTTEPAKLIAMHLMITPEYVRNMREAHPDVIVYALRLDRGLSTEKALASVPGTHWDEERGLTDTQYIVPGAGGVGELLNNAWV